MCGDFWQLTHAYHKWLLRGGKCYLLDFFFLYRFCIKKAKKIHKSRIKNKGGLEYKRTFAFRFFICNAIHHRNPPYNIPISPHNTPKHPLQTPHTPPKTHHKLSVNSLIKTPIFTPHKEPELFFNTSLNTF